MSLRHAGRRRHHSAAFETAVVARLRANTTVRAVGIDDWSWQRGCTYGTIIVDLERREVVDVLQDRASAGTAEWLRQHPEVEIVSRDRCGLYAQARARERPMRGKSLADFHRLQNLRERSRPS